MIKLYHAQGSLGLRRVEHGSYGERSRNGHESKLEERPSLAPGRHHLNALGASCGCTALTAWTCLTTLLPPCLGSEDFSATHTREQALMARIHFTEGSFSASHRSYRAHHAWFGGECWKQLCEHRVYSTHSSVSFPTLIDIIKFFLFFPFKKNIYLFWLCWVLVAARGLIVGAGMWALVPQPGTRPGLPALGAVSPPGPQGKPLSSSSCSSFSTSFFPFSSSCFVFLFSFHPLFNLSLGKNFSHH